MRSVTALKRELERIRYELKAYLIDIEELVSYGFGSDELQEQAFHLRDIAEKLVAASKED